VGEVENGRAINCDDFGRDDETEIEAEEEDVRGVGWALGAR
jgi:hypothetical protein